MIKKIKVLLTNLFLKIKHTLSFLKKREKKFKDNPDDIYPLF